ncbi:MAG: DUF2332 family protein [Streptosporangiaceae bacterium]
MGLPVRHPDGDRRIGAGDRRLTLTCAVEGRPPLPAAPPPIAWRVGLDRQPIDPADPDARRWFVLPDLAGTH